MRSWRMHHVGIATRNLDGLTGRLENVGFDLEKRFTDPLQGVDGAFLLGGDSRIELLAPLEGSDTLEPWLNSGNRMYQIAVEVDDLDAEIASVRDAGGRLVREPMPAVAFDGRRIAFMMIGTGFLLELIESA